MTLPSTGSISLNQVNTELSRTATQNISLGESAVRSLAGVTSGAISMSNLRGKAYLTFSPTPGSYVYSGQVTAMVTVTSNKTASWSYTKTGANVSASFTNGYNGTSVQLRVDAVLVGETYSPRVATVALSAVVDGTTYNWSIQLSAEGNL